MGLQPVVLIAVPGLIVQQPQAVAPLAVSGRIVEHPQVSVTALLDTTAQGQQV